MSVRSLNAWLLILAWTMALAPAHASASAYQVVEETTRRVMAVVADASDYADQDPERYYSAVHEVLDPVIDYRGFARSVMGPYATSERYKSLDEAGRAALRAQLDRFTEVMRTGLVRTYGKGLLAFGGSRIEVSESPSGEADSRRASVVQLIYDEQPEPYKVLYQMGRDKSGQWKLRNVIIESVNLGEIYRNQFEAAARKYDGDLDSVIDNWTTQEIET